MSISGLQTWLALPDGKEEIAPLFENTAARRAARDSMPTASRGRVVIGAFDGIRSPVRTASETLYVDLRLDAGRQRAASLPMPRSGRSMCWTARSTISGDRFPSDRLLVFRPGDEIVVVVASSGAHFMLFGGASLGSKRYIWWNFVSSSKERIEQAKEEWKTGPLRHRSRRRGRIHPACPKDSMSLRRVSRIYFRAGAGLFRG